MAFVDEKPLTTLASQRSAFVTRNGSINKVTFRYYVILRCCCVTIVSWSNGKFDYVQFPKDLRSFFLLIFRANFQSGCVCFNRPERKALCCQFIGSSTVRHCNELGARLLPRHECHPDHRRLYCSWTGLPLCHCYIDLDLFQGKELNLELCS